MKLWFDDVRPAPKGWVWARTLHQAIESLETGAISECSLDHDLGLHDVEIPDDPDALLEVIYYKGQSEETGLDLVRWMVENNRVPAVITIHSWNPDGARNMAALLVQHGHECTIAPYKPS